MKPTLHSVAMAEPSRHVLYRGGCVCGWKVYYDPATYDAAVERAHQHCADEFEADLEADPERS